MAGTERISSFQLFCLMLLFEIGTAIMVPLGIDAKQDAWIAILLGMLGGLLIFFIYAYLHRTFPHQPLTSYVKQIIGRDIGFVVSLLYLLFFMYGAARDLRDGMELLRPAYNETPVFAVGLIIMIVVCYSLYHGLEVLSRVGEIYFFLFVLTGILALICLFFSGVIDITKTQPWLEKGWKPTFAAAYEQTVMFPFGEMICFTMVMPHVSHLQSVFKMGVLCILISGTALSFVVFLELSVLGTDKMGTLMFPFLRLMQYINIGDVVQRLDAFVLISLILNDFFKVTIFAYAAIAAASDLFRITQNKFIIPIGVVILFASLAIAPDATAHFNQGRFALKFIFPPFALYIPFLLMIIAWLRAKLKKNKQAR